MQAELEVLLFRYIDSVGVKELAKIPITEKQTIDGTKLDLEHDNYTRELNDESASKVFSYMPVGSNVPVYYNISPEDPVPEFIKERKDELYENYKKNVLSMYVHLLRIQACARNESIVKTIEGVRGIIKDIFRFEIVLLQERHITPMEFEEGTISIRASLLKWMTTGEFPSSNVMSKKW